MMKRSVLFGLVLLGVAALGYWASHRMAPVAVKQGKLVVERLPELKWLEQELALDAAQIEKVRALHLAYRPTCGEMCEKIELAKTEVDRLANDARGVTPELQKALDHYFKVQGECQSAVLRHVYETARSMNETQSKRYLELVLPAALAGQHPH
jgi:plasmid maintenance system antidote protein VapI